jgi:hypothetical protein
MLLILYTCPVVFILFGGPVVLDIVRSSSHPLLTSFDVLILLIVFAHLVLLILSCGVIELIRVVFGCQIVFVLFVYVIVLMFVGDIIIYLCNFVDVCW